MTVSEKLSSYAAGLRYEDLSEEVKHAAKRLLLDTLGFTIAAYPYEAGKITRSILGELGGPEEATIIGSGIKTSCLNAILVNGAMARYHDFHNMYISPNGPSAASLHIPAILAVGERERVTGKDLLTAIFLNYELTGRIVDAPTSSRHNLPAGRTGWHSSTLTPYVVPLVVGKLLGMSENQMANAMGIAGFRSGALMVIDAEGEEYNQARNIAWALASQTGYLAALLARKGFTGPLGVIDGNHGYMQDMHGNEYDVKQLIDGGETPKILLTSFKSHCACSAGVTVIDAALLLAKEHKIQPEEVEKIQIYARKRSVQHVGDPTKRFPTNQEAAGHSLYFLVSMAIIEGVVGPEQVSGLKLKDPKVRALSEKVSIDADPELDKVREGNLARVEITTKQGKKYSQSVQFQKGHYKQNPFTDQDIVDKFRVCTSRFFSEEEIDKIIDTVNNLEKIVDARELMKLLII